MNKLPCKIKNRQISFDWVNAASGNCDLGIIIALPITQVLADCIIVGILISVISFGNNCHMLQNISLSHRVERMDRYSLLCH